MKWKRQDMQQYLKSKEYIDTAIVPLLPFSMEGNDEDLLSLTYQHEVMDVFTERLEKEYKGRIFRFPTYSYLATSKIEDEVERLNGYYEQLKTQPFQFVFYLTFDAKWKKHEKNLEGQLLWLPILKDGDIHQEETKKVILDQNEQITDLIRAYWSET
ncbi:DUF2487 family protein [Salinibacillus xinjiangensis]|uniref:DUF2487 family protein n=1 Tax=Salinibacillus xinjiangensis TaxID=1229268 RepID=A0A6G1X628_9BACI|nr:DUF2487 family protein [Salinibacillus xinjiangensis]MRG86392.1 DUF2487 family protein [Salinibacillus xinjiangensis]